MTGNDLAPIGELFERWTTPDIRALYHKPPTSALSATRGRLRALALAIMLCSPGTKEPQAIADAERLLAERAEARPCLRLIHSTFPLVVVLVEAPVSDEDLLLALFVCCWAHVRGWVEIPAAPLTLCEARRLCGEALSTWHHVRGGAA
ncbi:hypothetical protein L6R46_06015 [Myxococcota bacterium]|nr:hypothetical protein [Myxococcota bacterium]